MASSGGGTGVGVDVSVPEAAAFSARMTHWGEALANPRPAFEQMSRKLNESQAQIFDTNGAALGHPWAQAAEPERKTTSQLLVATGALRRSLTGRTSDSVDVATSTEFRFSTRVPYAPFHQFGTSKMPARPFIGVTANMREQVTEAVRTYSEQSAGAGLTL